MADLTQLHACIVGGGNASHACVSILGHLGVKKITVFAPFGDEAARWKQGLEATNGKVEATLPGDVVLTGTADKVSADPAEVVPGAHFVLIPLPSFARRPVLDAMAPHLDKGAWVGAMPGQGGWQWICDAVLRDKHKRRDVGYFSVIPLPFNARITSFGQKVNVMGMKKNLSVAASSREGAAHVCALVSACFDAPVENVEHTLAITLFPRNQVIHPSRLYEILHEWKPGQILKENPRFYEDLGDLAANTMIEMDKETQLICKALEEASHGDILFTKLVPSVGGCVIKWYPGQVGDESTVKTCFRTNKGYAGLFTPLKQVEGGWLPDFTSRYFTEDIPNNLCVVKGVADIVGVATPTMDKILLWAQAHMGKEYIVDGKLKGKDAKETSAPQQFGFHTVEQLLRGSA